MCLFCLVFTATTADRFYRIDRAQVSLTLWLFRSLFLKVCVGGGRARKMNVINLVKATESINHHNQNYYVYYSFVVVIIRMGLIQTTEKQIAYK